MPLNQRYDSLVQGHFYVADVVDPQQFSYICFMDSAFCTAILFYLAKEASVVVESRSATVEAYQEVENGLPKIPISVSVRVTCRFACDNDAALRQTAVG